MAINSVSDLIVGNEYYLAEDDEDARGAIRVKLLDVEYPSKLHPTLSQISVSHPVYIEMVFDTHTIGIGETRAEAKANFERFK